MRAFLLGLLLVGCGSVAPISPDGGGSGTDGPATGDAGPPRFCDPQGSTDHCEGSTIQRCNPEGTAFVAVPCPLGCADGPPPRCRTLVPSLPAIDPSWLCMGTAALATHDVREGSLTFFTDEGQILDETGAQVRAPGSGVSDGIFFRNLDQPGASNPAAPPIGVFAVRSLVVRRNTQLVGVGASALAILVCEDLQLDGVISVAARSEQRGPGAVTGIGEGGPGQDGMVASGAGGAGHASFGGDGGSGNPYGGGMGGQLYGDDSFQVLLGGSDGGDGVPAPGGPPVTGGGGGGALYLAVGGILRIGDSGAIHAGGGGGAPGRSGGGGGSGGSIFVETVGLEIAGGTFAANGGGGGGTSTYGNDGTLSDLRAAGGLDSNFKRIGGLGGAIDVANGDPGVAYSGGGGGAAGRIRLNTPSGEEELGPLVVSPRPYGFSRGAVRSQ